MGYYIQGPTKGKSEFIQKEYGAILLDSPAQAREAFAEGFGVICVVDNGLFEGAAFAYSGRELEVFLAPDNRPKMYLAMDRKKAEELSGYSP